MKDVAIIIPAWNEAKSLKRVLNKLKTHVPEADLIVVNDASSDATARVAANTGVVVLNHVVNMGAWKATQTGIRYAVKHGYQFVISMDADGQHLPETIPSLLDHARQGYDLVVGSCTSRGSLGRHIAWRSFKAVTGLQINDLTSGLRCYSRPASQVLASRQATMFEYQDVGVLLMLRHLKMTMIEAQVPMAEREDGISRIFYSWFAVFKYLLYTSILSVTKALPASPEAYYKKLTSGENT